MFVLDLTDIVVSKLIRFKPEDIQDIGVVIAHGKVKHSYLLERFCRVVDYISLDARADDLPVYVKNLHTIEKTLFHVPESPIDLPDWIP